MSRTSCHFQNTMLQKVYRGFCIFFYHSFLSSFKTSFSFQKQICKFHPKARFGPIYGRIVEHSLHNMDQGGIFARWVSSTSLYMMISIFSNDHQHVVKWWATSLFMMVSIVLNEHHLSTCPQHLSSTSEDKFHLCLDVQCEDNSVMLFFLWFILHWSQQRKGYWSIATRFISNDLIHF